MLHLPAEFQGLISVFSGLFTQPTFKNASQLLLGCILTQGKRTVCGVLRTLGLAQDQNWHKFHRVLSQSKWSALKCSQKLLAFMIEQFTHTDRLLFALDDTLERRWGKKIAARGVYHDAVRSSKGYHVKCSGLRWCCLMLLVNIPWAKRVWALPFLTVLAPSERYHEGLNKVHKTLTDWARQMALQLHRWLPDMEKVIVADNSYARMELFKATIAYVCWITNMRLDSCLYDFAPPYKKGQMGRPPQKGKKQPSLQMRLVDKTTNWIPVHFSKWYNQADKWMEISVGKAIWYRAGKASIPILWILIRDPKGKMEPRAILSTDLNLEAKQVIEMYLHRWQIEVTFEEVRAHLGVESQRQRSHLSILRTTPCLMALFTLVTIWADQLFQLKLLKLHTTAWYKKESFTFADAIASVRARIWSVQLNLHLGFRPKCEKNEYDIYQHLAFMATRAI